MLLCGLIGVAGVTLATGCPSGGVGDPCIPEDEYLSGFSGFKLGEESIESRAFQCQSRVCLVNHFQGRVTCPQGQAPPTACAPANGGAECAADETCTEAELGTACTSDGDCPVEGSWVCDPVSGRCAAHVCSRPGDPNRCYLPGTNTPVRGAVCGQCAADSHRNAEDAVYCSCRCGLAEGEDPNAPANANATFCDCPSGFACAEIRKYVGLGDQQLAGKYCIKEGTSFRSVESCGAVRGHHDTAFCAGLPEL